MSLVSHQIAAIFLLSIALLIYLLLGESHYFFIISGGFSLLMLLFLPKFEWKRIYHQKSIFFIWIGYLVSILISAYFTHSIPLTLTSVNYYFVIFLFFVFFSLLDVTADFISVLLGGFLLVGVFLSVVSMTLLAFPAYASLLPGMNVLYSTYGHNHLGAVLILLLPVAWWFSLNTVRKKWFFLFICGLFTLNILLSFGRVIVFLGFLETLIIFGLSRKNNIFSRKTNSFFFVLLLSSFLAILGMSLLFSLSDKLSLEWLCPPIHKNRICKQLSKESRVLYWNQALESVKEYLLTGYGPGTYQLISQKYKLAPYINSGYAHNAYLQQFAELGLVGGGFFLILTLGVLFYLWRRLESWRSPQLPHFMWLGLLAIQVNVLFDFDWSFSGIFLLTMIFIATLLSSQRQVVTSQRKSDEIFVLVVKALFLLGILIVFLSGVFSLWTEILIKNNWGKEAFKNFPYFFSQKNFFISQAKSDEVIQRQMQMIYKWHADVNQELNRQKSSNLSFLAYAAETDPWSIQYVAELPSVPVEENIDLANKIFEKVFLVFSQGSEKYGYVLDYKRKRDLALVIVKIANHYYEHSNYELAAQNYLRAYYFDNWVFSYGEIAFLEVSPDENFFEFFSKLESVSTEHFGSNKDNLGNVLIKNVLAIYKSAGDVSVSVPVANRLTEAIPWQVNGFWIEISRESQQQFSEYYIDNDFFRAQSILDQWFAVWEAVSAHPQLNVDNDATLALSEALASYAGRMSNVDEELAHEYLYKAQQVGRIQ